MIVYDVFFLEPYKRYSEYTNITWFFDLHES